jgi:hypothetical protein
LLTLRSTNLELLTMDVVVQPDAPEDRVFLFKYARLTLPPCLLDGFCTRAKPGFSPLSFAEVLARAAGVPEATLKRADEAITLSMVLQVSLTWVPTQVRQARAAGRRLPQLLGGQAGDVERRQQRQVWELLMQFDVCAAPSLASLSVCVYFVVCPVFRCLPC